MSAITLFQPPLVDHGIVTMGQDIAKTYNATRLGHSGADIQVVFDETAQGLPNDLEFPFHGTPDRLVGQVAGFGKTLRVLLNGGRGDANIL